MSQAMLGHCGLEVLSILPQKTAWAKDDEATLSKHQAEGFVSNPLTPATSPIVALVVSTQKT